MISKIMIREEWVVAFLGDAFDEVRGGDALSPQQEKELLKHIIAMGAARVDIPSAYSLPPDGASIRGAMTKAVRELRFFLNPYVSPDAVVEEIRIDSAWNEMRRLAERRLVALER